MNETRYSVAIVGCGWLGLPFAKHVLAKGWHAVGTTTSPEKVEKLRSNGIDGFVLNLPPQDELPHSIFDVDVILLNVPPGRSQPELIENYPGSIALLLEKVKESNRLKQLVFTSSTSVYGSEGDVINEGRIPNPTTESGKAVLRAEQFVIESGVPFVILRFGGLAGPGRHPGKFLAGKSGIRTGHQSVNMLHLTDAIRVIEHMISHHIVGETYNVVSPAHPTKENFYTKMSQQLQLRPPTFEESHNNGKREISVDKLVSETGFEFVFPDPMDFTFD
jgi:nucleoside-diphosphate-sugar epimerase